MNPRRRTDRSTVRCRAAKSPATLRLATLVQFTALECLVYGGVVVERLLVKDKVHGSNPGEFCDRRQIILRVSPIRGAT